MKSVDFKDFDSRFEGYVVIDGETIYVPAIVSKKPRQGNFTDLVNKLKAQYCEIRFTAVVSNALIIALAHKDFHPETVRYDGEDQLNLVWKEER